MTTLLKHDIIKLPNKVIHKKKMAKISENPLTKYKRENKLSWNDLSNEVGISKQSLINISHLTPKTMGKIRVETAIKLNEKLGVSLMEYLLTK